MPSHGRPSRIQAALTEVRTAIPHHGLIKQVADHHSINQKTLGKAVRRERTLLGNTNTLINDRVIERVQRRVEPRGATSNRLFTDDQEELICQHLKSEYPRGFKNKHILNFAVQLTHNTRSHPRLFSKHWLLTFKRRNGITTSRFRIRKITQQPQEDTFQSDIDACCMYLENVESLSNRFPARLIINVDETPSYVRNAPTSMLHFVHTPPPWGYSRVSEKKKVTVIGACTASGRMLKPAVIAKGTTSRCEQKYRHLIHSSVFIQHTGSGNTTALSFIDYLEHVIVPYTQNQPSVLIVDSYAAHLTESVRSFCVNHCIELVVVPERATAELQPLDCAVFAAAKNPIYQ